MIQELGAVLLEELDRRRIRAAISPELIMQVAKERGIDLTVTQFAALVWRLGHTQGETVCLPHVVEFISSYVSDLRPMSILDPSAGFGSLLIPLVTATGATHARAITRTPSNLEIGKELDNSGVISWLCGDPLEELNAVQESFDMIASSPPWGLGQTQRMNFEVSGRIVEVNDDVGHLLILKSLLRLSDNGVGLFIVPPTFISRVRSKGVYANLPRFGFSLDAFISFPAGTFALFTNIQGGMAIVRRGAQESIFVGELTENPDRRRAADRDHK